MNRVISARSEKTAEHQWAFFSGLMWLTGITDAAPNPNLAAEEAPLCSTQTSAWLLLPNI